MKTPHKHAEFIHAWANGEEIEFFNDGLQKWDFSCNPNWYADCKYRIKPEREYPKTSMTHEALRNVYFEGRRSADESFEAVANAAIKQHIIDTEGESK